LGGCLFSAIESYKDKTLHLGVVESFSPFAKIRTFPVSTLIKEKKKQA
jgi:hypothetical protein